MINISDKPAPKTVPAGMPGHLEAKYVRCGKPRCRCARGELHGPYYRRAYWAGGQRQRCYVRLDTLDTTREAVAEWRAEREKQRTGRMTVRAFRALVRAYRLLSADVIGALGG